MRKIVIAASVVCAAAVAGLAVRASASTARIEVAGHRFDVPKGHLFDMPIPWLPKPDGDSFIFLLQPNPEPNRIPDHRFLVEPLARLCPGDASQLLRIACGTEKAVIDEGPPYQKQQSGLGAWSSNIYSIRQPPDKRGEQRRQVAFCKRFEPNPAKPKVTTSCTTFWAYKGMMLQFDFDEKELPNMLAMKRDAMRLLDSWEVK